MNKPVLTVVSLMPIVLLALLLAGCREPPDRQAEFYVFGTQLEVLMRGATKPQASAALQTLGPALQAMHNDWHAWEPSTVTAINQAFVQGKNHQAPQDILALIHASREMEVASEGRFNATVGQLIGLWGFHTSDYPVTGPLPTPQAINALLRQHPSATDIDIRGSQVSSRNPTVQLDFGAIAKGYAVDQVLADLKTHGIEAALVNAGGDLAFMGGTKARPWRVGIRRPGGGVIAGLRGIGAAAVFTSGVDQRYAKQQGQRYPHIIDPRTGQAVQGLASVTVVTDLGMQADAAATALMVAGPQEWRETAQAMGINKVLVVDEQGLISVSAALAPLLEWPEGPPDNLRVVRLSE